MLLFRPLQKLLSWTMNGHEEELRAAGKRVLVAGLGNHSLSGTRHSVGMAVLNHLATKLNVADQWRKDKRCCADVAFKSLGEVELVLMKPRSFMNVNGRCVVSAAEVFNLQAEDIYLVHDELDKSFGKVAMKLGGSARGHNGVRSCIESLRSDRMLRLRIGIGRPMGEAAVDHYVLSRFTRAEEELLPQVFEQAVTMLLGHIQQRMSSPGGPNTSGAPAKTPLRMEGA